MSILNLTDEEFTTAVTRARIAKTLETIKIRQRLEREEQHRKHENEIRDLQKVCSEVGHVLEQIRGDALRKFCTVCGAVI